MVVYPGLRYERTEGGYHVFQLPVQHPGHDAFQGCSGAPILDMERRVVGLVCSGSIPDNTISCVSLARYGVALDAHILWAEAYKCVHAEIDSQPRQLGTKRSAERHLGKEGVSTCS